MAGVPRSAQSELLLKQPGLEHLRNEPTSIFLPRFAALRPGCPHLPVVASRWKRGGGTAARGGRRGGPGGGVLPVLSLPALALSQQLLNDRLSCVGGGTADWGEQASPEAFHYPPYIAKGSLVHRLESGEHQSLSKCCFQLASYKWIRDLKIITSCVATRKVWHRSLYVQAQSTASRWLFPLNFAEETHSSINNAFAIIKQFLLR